MAERDRSGSGPRLDRRSLFAAAAAGGVASAGALVAKPAKAQPASAPGPTPPSAAAMAAEHEAPPSGPGQLGRTGADQMVDCLRHLGIDYVATMPGSSFRGLHESLINYGGDKSPEILTCLHEEISVALAHGYAKTAGKPMAAMVHGVVGVQHASMAIYNAWADKVPVFIVAGNALQGALRRPGPEWYHSAQDNAAMVRDFLKWDAQPISPLDFTEASLRAYGVAVTPPAGPVMITADGELQENEARAVPIPRFRLPTPPSGDTAALDEAARMLVAAEKPVIVAERLARTPAGMALLTQLAEALQAPVIDRYGRLNIATTHYLCQTDLAGPLIRGADVILGLELSDPWGTVNQLLDRAPRLERRVARADAKLIDLSANSLSMRANIQDQQRFMAADLPVSGDGEASLPYLLEKVRSLVGAGVANRSDRKTGLQDAWRKMRDQAVADAAYGWDASPIALSRLCWEVWKQVKDLDWALVGGDYQFRGYWPHRLWNFDRHYQFNGGAGGAGVGYCAPAAVGSALAHKEHGRIAINIQGDGDLMCAPGSLWTAAHHAIPMLTVVHNNRAYHQEMMHIQRVTGRHSRGVGRSHIGTTIDSPNIDYAKLAQGLGVWATGPVTDPAALPGAIKRALEVAKAGQPALIDVVCQPR